MRKLYILTPFILLFAFCFFACSDDNKDDGINPLDPAGPNRISFLIQDIDSQFILDDDLDLLSIENAKIVFDGKELPLLANPSSDTAICFYKAKGLIDEKVGIHTILTLRGLHNPELGKEYKMTLDLGGGLTDEVKFIYKSITLGGYTMDIYLNDKLCEEGQMVRIFKTDNQIDVTDKLIDPQFKAYSLANFDKNGDGRLTYDETKQVKELVMPTTSGAEAISDFQSVRCFPSLEKLDVSGNPIKELNLSKNIILRDFRCDDCTQLNELKLPVSDSLKVVSCKSTNLEVLDLSRNLGLQKVDCSGNDSQLKELKLPSTSTLSDLICNGNKLENLNFSGNSELKILNCNNNSLSKLSITSSLLEELYCAKNKLTQLDVTDAEAMEVLHCNDNLLKSLNLSKNKMLERLHCQNDSLKKLDISKNIRLIELNCKNNQIDTISVWKEFNISDPKLTLTAGITKDDAAVFVVKKEEEKTK